MPTPDEIVKQPTVVEPGRRGPKGHLLQFNGQTLTIRQWSLKTGLKHDTITTRLKRGWTPERTLTEPENTNGADVQFERLRILSVKIGDLDAEIEKMLRAKEKLQKEFDTLSSQYKE